MSRLVRGKLEDRYSIHSISVRALVSTNRIYAKVAYDIPHEVLEPERGRLS